MTPSQMEVFNATGLIFPLRPEELQPAGWVEQPRKLEIGPDPCRGCRLFQDCQENSMACMDFSQFTNTGKLVRKSRIPSTRIYNRIFRQEARDDE